MNDTDLLTLAADLVDAEPGTLALSDRLDDLGWDSLASAMFIAEADSACGVVVDAEALGRCVTQADVQALTVAVPA
jgi:acyl carrier protein